LAYPVHAEAAESFVSALGVVRQWRVHAARVLVTSIFGAAIAVIAVSVDRDHVTAAAGIAGIQGTWNPVTAVQGEGAVCADAAVADVTLCARVAIVAVVRIGLMGAASDLITRVRGADVAVVARNRVIANTLVAYAVGARHEDISVTMVCCLTLSAHPIASVAAAILARTIRDADTRSLKGAEVAVGARPAVSTAAVRTAGLVSAVGFAAAYALFAGPAVGARAAASFATVVSTFLT